MQHGKTYANLGKDDDILEIGGNRAIDLIRAKESGLSGRSFGKQASTASRALGDHPDGGAVAIKAGRFGPYVSWGKINATLPKDADPTTYSLDEAVTLLAAKQSGASASQGRPLGDHPDGGAVTVRAGRFGPYVAWGKIYATLPKDASPDTIGLDEALRLIEAKAGKSPAKKAPAKKAPAKKAAPAKKPAAKAKADDDSAPFEGAKKIVKPIAKAAVKKAPAKKAVAKKAPAKKAAKKK